MALLETPYKATISRIACKDLTNVEMGTIGWSGITAGKNDPYVKLAFENWNDKTEYQDDAGEAAEWDNLNMQFNAIEQSLRFKEIKIEVYDYNSISRHTFIGEATLYIGSVLDMKVKESELSIDIKDKKNKRSGLVTLNIKLEIDIEAIKAKKLAELERERSEQEAIDYIMRDVKPFQGFFEVMKVVCEDLFNVEAVQKNDPFVEIQFGPKTQLTTQMVGAGNCCDWNDLRMRWDADETAMRMDFLDIRVSNYKDIGNHEFIGDASIPLYELLDANVGKKIEKSVDIKNKKNKRAGLVKITIASHRYSAQRLAELAEPRVKYVSAEEIIKEVSYERITLPRYKLQITDKFLTSIQKQFESQNTFISLRLEAYGLVTKIISALDDGTIEVREEKINSKKGPEKGPIDKIIESGHQRSIRRICVWQGDGVTFLLTASSDGTCRIFDFDSNKFLREMRGHEGPVLCLAVSADVDVKKCLVATGGTDCSVRLYYMSSGRQRICMVGHKWKVVAVCFSDPKFTVGGSQVVCSLDMRGEIRLWEREKGTLLRVLNAQTPVTIHDLPDYDKGGC